MTEPKTESVVLCEGYYDRAFWAGWLKHVGCVDPSEPVEGGNRRPVIDPWGFRVAGGHFGFHSTTKRFVRIVPCQGKTKLLPEMRARLKDEAEQVRADPSLSRLARLVVATEPDTLAESASPETGLRPQDLLAVVREFEPQAQEDDQHDIVLFAGATRVSLVRWEVAPANQLGVPARQTLERLVCAALVAAFPQRGQVVQDWLESRPDDPPTGPKEFAWSHMAGWYAEHGCQEFYSYLWKAETGDGRVREELEKRLRACGAWQIAEALAQ
jgi:hypothetical protein